MSITGTTTQTQAILRYRESSKTRRIFEQTKLFFKFSTNDIRNMTDWVTGVVIYSSIIYQTMYVLHSAIERSIQSLGPTSIKFHSGALM